MAARSHPLCLGSRRKATIDHSLLCIHHNQLAFPLQPSFYHLKHPAMLLACLWPCLCPGAVGCGSSESRAHGSQRTPTLAPRRATPFAQQKGKERLLSCWPAAATTAVTAIITIVVQLLLKHYVAFPPTSRCYRSTNNASHVRLITIWLIWSVFLPGSRATLATANNVSDTLASVEARGLKQMRGDSVLFPTLSLIHI